MITAAQTASGEWHHLPTGEYRIEAGVFQNAFHLVPFVALDFNAAIFHGASDPAGFPYLLREFLFIAR
jgi:hypothetical protein